ncbi:hypothetical protein DL96DRAFT_1552815 [Flagelloscypha sp. PMI_526]|nr:hypothetical protein DL96DRAFT_1552815 [Flagelloscypha sp. PMI_526]
MKQVTGYTSKWSAKLGLPQIWGTGDGWSQKRDGHNRHSSLLNTVISVLTVLESRLHQHHISHSPSTAQPGPSRLLNQTPSTTDGYSRGHLHTILNRPPPPPVTSNEHVQVQTNRIMAHFQVANEPEVKALSNLTQTLQSERDLWQSRALSYETKLEHVLKERARESRETGERAQGLARGELLKRTKAWEDLHILKNYIDDTGEFAWKLHDDLANLITKLACHLDIKPSPDFEHHGRPFANPATFNALLERCIVRLNTHTVNSLDIARASASASDFQELEDAKARLQLDLKAAEQDRSTLLGQIDQLRQNEVASQQHLAALRSQLVDIERGFKESRDNQSKSIELLTQQLSDVTVKAKTAEQAVEEMTTQRNGYKSNRDEWHNKAVELEARLESENLAKTSLEQASQRLQQKLEDLQTTHDTEVANHLQKVKALQDELKEARDDAETQCQQSTDLEDQVHVLRGSLDQALEDKKSWQTSCNSMTAEVENAKDEMDKSRKEYMDLQASFEDIQAKSTGELTALRAELTQALCLSESLKEELNVFRASSSAIEELRVELDELKIVHADLHKAFDLEKGQHQSVCNERNTLQRLVSKMREESNQTISHKERELAELRGEARARAESLKEQDGIILLRDEEVGNLRGQLHQVQSSLRTSEEHSRSLQSQLDALNLKVKSAPSPQVHRDLDQRYQDAKKEIATLKQQLKSQKDSNDAQKLSAKQEIERLTAVEKELEKKLSDSEKQKEDLAEELGKEQQRLANLRSQGQSFTARLMKENEEMTRERDELRKRLGGELGESSLQAAAAATASPVSAISVIRSKEIQDPRLARSDTMGPSSPQLRDGQTTPSTGIRDPPLSPPLTPASPPLPVGSSEMEVDQQQQSHLSKAPSEPHFHENSITMPSPSQPHSASRRSSYVPSTPTQPSTSKSSPYVPSAVSPSSRRPSLSDVGSSSRRSSLAEVPASAGLPSRPTSPRALESHPSIKRKASEMDYSSSSSAERSGSYGQYAGRGRPPPSAPASYPQHAPRAPYRPQDSSRNSKSTPDSYPRSSSHMRKPQKGRDGRGESRGRV